MTPQHHQISYEAQPIADQWLARCSCGWRANVSAYDFPTRDAVLKEAERVGRDHLHSIPEGDTGQELRR